MKKILILIICFFTLIPLTYGVSYHSYGVTEHEKQLKQEETKENNDLLNDLSYRLLEKDDKDNIDYTILSILIVLITLIIVLLNKRTYIIFKEEDVFQTEPNGLY